MFKVDDMVKHDDYIGYIIKVNDDDYCDVWFPMVATNYTTEEIHIDELEIATDKDLEL